MTSWRITPDLMRPAKREKLEAAQWRVGDAEDFLELTADEIELVEEKLELERRTREVPKEND